MRVRLLTSGRAAALLVVGFELPTLSLAEPLRPSADLLVLVTAWLLAARLRGGRFVRAAVLIIAGLLLLHRIDRAGLLLCLGDEPLLYDQMFLVRHLLVMIGDIWTLSLAAGLLGVIAGLALIAIGMRRLFSELALPAAPELQRRVYLAGALLWAVALVGSFVPLGKAPAVRWATGALVSNLQESRRIYRAVQRRLGASPYSGYHEIALRRRPDVYLILVESYGRVMVDHPQLRAASAEQIASMQRSLSAAGWHAVSAFSRAPVMGGRSWLAEATLLMGMRVGYEAVFRHLAQQIERVPHLVRFLEQQGYYTVLLAPSDRERTGIQIANHYGYDRAVRFDDLDYRGARFGWGLVPDQYSLAYTEQNVLRAAAHPLFFNFHMVSSHAPWKEVPALVDDWRTLSSGTERLDDGDKPAPFKPLSRYVHSQRRFTYMGEFEDTVGERYTGAILYELKLIESFLARLKDDALVIVIGDHQPPFIAAQTQSFDTPVHVFARDPALLAELRAHGFGDGLRLDPQLAAALRHEGLFSLIVRSLARCCSAAQPLPVYRRNGARLGS